MTVLVLTRELDFHADLVVGELGRRGVPVLRCDAGDFPLSLRLTARIGPGGSWTGTLATCQRTVALEEIRSVYYRRPSRFVFASGMSVTEQRFAEAEARIGFAGVLSTLRCGWVNHPHRNAEAALKPLQLQVAAECGLAVPATVVTNEPEQARRFVTGQRTGAVYKALSVGPLVERNQPVALYTSAVSAAEVADGSVARTATQLQRRLRGYDVRLTVVGEQGFAARIDTDPAARPDWRAAPEATHHVIEPPQPVRDGVGELMGRLGLRFGALDFIVTQEEWIFLEINPNGQWAWIEDATGLPITAALADLLQELP